MSLNTLLSNPEHFDVRVVRASAHDLGNVIYPNKEMNDNQWVIPLLGEGTRQTSYTLYLYTILYYIYTNTILIYLKGCS